MQKAMKQLEEVEAEADKNTATLEEIETCKLKMAEAESVCRDIGNQLQHLQRQATSLQDKMSRQEKAHKTKMDKCQEDLRAVLDDISDVSREQTSMKQKSEMNAQIMKKIQEKVRASRVRHRYTHI